MLNQKIMTIIDAVSELINHFYSSVRNALTLKGEEDILVILSSDNATMPTRGSDEAAGLDLYSSEDKVLPHKDQTDVETDIVVLVPKGTYGRVAPRSGLCVKNKITTGAGVVDRDYRGSLKVILVNGSDTDFQVKKGMRIAQLVCEKVAYPTPRQVGSLPPTNRQSNGFGSTGGM